MSKSSKKRKFSNNQIVVFRFGDRKIVGKVILVRPVGKKFTYDVYAEDGKIYSELLADAALNLSIDTYLTKLFYRKYNLDENSIPDLTEDVLPSLVMPTMVESVTDEQSDDVEEEEEKEFFLDEDADPNY